MRIIPEDCDWYSGNLDSENYGKLVSRRRVYCGRMAEQESNREVK